MSKTPILGEPHRSLAFFDIDGTLTTGFTIAAFAEFLCEKGCFDRECLDLMRRDKAAYQESERSKHDYHEFAVNWVNHYAQGLKGQQAEYVQSLSAPFLNSALKREIPDYEIHDFAKLLVETFNPVATTIAVSGSPWESLESLTTYLGFRQLNSTLIEMEQGRYTGQIDRNLAITESKRQVVDSYVVDDVDLKMSFAFGDSLQDVPMLEAVGNPFVLGGNRALQVIGRRRGWFVTSQGVDIVAVVKNRISALYGGMVS